VEPRASVAPASLAVSPGALDGRALLDGAALVAAQAGAGTLDLVVSGVAAEHERVGAFVEASPGTCLLAVARGASSVDDVDLAAFAEDGSLLAVDDGPDPHPAVLVCVARPGRVYLSVAAAAGEGLVAIGGLAIAQARSAAVARALGAHGSRTDPAHATDAWPGLDDHIRRRTDSLGGHWETLRRVGVAVDARLPGVLPFPVDAESCTDALVVPDDDIAGLDVEVLDDRGRLVSRASSGDRDRSVTVCSPFAFAGTLTVRPHTGQGLAAVAFSRGANDLARDRAVRPDVAWNSAAEPVDRAVARFETALGAHGYGGPLGRELATLSVGAVRSVSIPARGAGPRSDACRRVDVVAGTPAGLVAANLWDDAGRLLTSAEGAASATLFACGDSRLRLDLESRGRPGPVAVTWRAEAWTDPAFASHPRAASRMLERASAGAAGLLDGEPAGARSFQAEGGHETSWPERLAAATCLHIAVGAEGAGAGLVGRIVDGVSGDELDRSGGATAIGLRACAGTEPRLVEVRVAVTAGRLDVVAASRVTR
jgi:hypothetical protein